MADSNSNPNDAIPDDDERLLHVLDRYVDALHADDAQSASVVIDNHPELDGLLRCLDSLEGIAPHAAELADEENGPATKTLVTPPIGGSVPPGAAGGLGSSITPPPVGDGQLFGKYELIEEIGRGGMGVVYRAKQTDLDRTVAVKMILSSALASSEDVRRFLAESKAAGRLRHRNIVGIHEAGQVHGQHFFAMDYVGGPSLGEWIRRTKPTPAQSAECLAAIARAVHYLHEQGIIHRDLKPSNILLDEAGVPHVTDFGLARVFTADSRQTQTGTILGTPSYMPPEQAAGKHADISPRSDVYSLGAILYEMLCGRPPFQHDNPLDVLVEVLEGEPDRPSVVNPNVPRELELICLKCLEKVPENRYASAQDLADDLECYLKGEPIDARPRGLWPVIRRWARREPALVSRLAGLLAAYSIVQARYFYNQLSHTSQHEAMYYIRIVVTLGVWAVVSLLFQRLLHKERWQAHARFGWAAADCILLTMALAFADGPRGLLLIGYPLLVAASGLFFKVRLVAFTTAMALATFLTLMFIKPDEARPFHYPAIFGATLIVIGCVVAYQVYRVRALSRYYDNRT